MAAQRTVISSPTDRNTQFRRKRPEDENGGGTQGAKSFSAPVRAIKWLLEWFARLQVVVQLGLIILVIILFAPQWIPALTGLISRFTFRVVSIA